MTLQEMLANANAEKTARYEILLKHINNGVKIIDIDTTFIDEGVEIGKDTTIYPCTYIHKDVKIGESCSIGPFAYIRPGTVLEDKVKIGDFVEVKNAHIGEGTKLSHLTYVGDTDVGKRVNFGCGTVIVNYDGKSKFRSTVEDDAFIGCNTNLVSPVTVRKGAYIAAGSTITNEVPAGALAIARSRQTNKLDWKDRRNYVIET